MKYKKIMKRLLCVSLVLTMLFGLAACGKSGEGKKDYSNAALAKEGVYTEQTFEIPGIADDMGVRMLTMVNDKIYAVYEVYDWDGSGQNQIVKVMSMNKDGSDIQANDLQMYLDGIKPESPVSVPETGESGTEDDEAVILPVQPRTMGLVEEAVEEAVAVDPGFGVDDDMSYVEQDYYEYTGLGSFSIGGDGNIYGTKNYYYENYSNPEKPVYINENYVCCWDRSGTMMWESKMEPLQTEESWAYIQSMISLKDGGVAVLIGGDKTELMMVGADGALGERKTLPEEISSLAGANIISNEDGVVTFSYWDMNGESKMWLNTFDFSTMKMGEPQQLPDSLFMSGYMALAGGGEVADFIYTTSLGVYAVNIGDAEPVLLMSFVNSDLATNNMNNVLVLDDKQILAFYYDNYDNVTKGGIFTKVNPEDIKDKAVMVLAANYIDYNLKNKVVEFNKTNPDYRIVIKDYSSYNTYEDYMAGYNQLNTDILASGMPDILVADTNMPIDSYISKGWLADIDKLIAEDEELSQKEFMQNVFDAYRVDGKLYYIIPSFHLRTMIAKTSIVGDRTTWTMREFMDLMATMPEGTGAMGEMTRGNFMYQMMQFCGNDFIDVNTGKCAFDSDNFKAMLEFAKSLPEEFSEDYYGEDYWMTYESQYRENRTVLMNCFVSKASEMNRFINGTFGEDVAYIGFPTDSGKGSVVMANQQYVLSSRSDNLQGAWEFMRDYLTEEYQSTLDYELPVDKAVFVSKAEEAMEKPYYLDENGEKVEYDDIFYMNGEEIILPQMTREQVDEFISFVEGIDKRTYNNENIQNIINEEAEAFFSGQKSVEDVAGIIQSRAQVYVNENS